MAKAKDVKDFSGDQELTPEELAALKAQASRKSAADVQAETQAALGKAGITGQYEWKPDPQSAAVAAAQASRPVTTNNDARIGTQIGDALGKFGSGFLQAHFGQQHAQAVKDAAVRGIQAARAAGDLQDTLDNAKRWKRDNPGQALPGTGPAQPVAPPPARYTYDPNAPVDAVSGPTPPPGEIQMTGDDAADATSDEGSKTDQEDARDMLRKAKPFSYEYKKGDQDPVKAPPGRRFGVMAQDLEKSRLGKAMVSTDPDTGRKVVNYGQGLGAMMAGLSAVADDVERLKKGRK